jgi:hypothetical protein
MMKRMQLDMRTACTAALMAACVIVAQAAGSRAVATGVGAPAWRVIEDPHLGRRWVLARDPEHPGGPGKLVEKAAGAAQSGSGPKALPVIRAGDRVLVEENTRVARGLFEAVALGTARPGASFRVRLCVGGRVVWAIAMGPGRATLAGADEVGQ